MLKRKNDKVSHTFPEDDSCVCVCVNVTTTKQ